MFARPSRPVLGIQRNLGISSVLVAAALLFVGCLTPEREEKKPEPVDRLDRYAAVPPPGVDVRPSSAPGASPVWIVLGPPKDCAAASAALGQVAHVVCADARVATADLEPALRAGLRKLKKDVTSRVTSEPVTVYAAPDAVQRGRGLVASAPEFFARAMLWVPPEGLGTLGATLLGRLGAEGGKAVVLLGVDGDALEPLVRSARRVGLSLFFFSDAPREPGELFVALRDRYGASVLLGAPAPGASGASSSPRPSVSAPGVSGASSSPHPLSSAPRQTAAARSSSGAQPAPRPSPGAAAAQPAP